MNIKNLILLFACALLLSCLTSAFYIITVGRTCPISRDGVNGIARCKSYNYAANGIYFISKDQFVESASNRVIYNFKENCFFISR